MIYEDQFGIRYKIQETLNSKMRGTGVPSYKIHESSTNQSWSPVLGPTLGHRWWRKAESAEKFLKDYAEKHHWKPVNEKG